MSKRYSVSALHPASEMTCIVSGGALISTHSHIPLFLVILCTCLSIGGRTFPVADFHLWNTLPPQNVASAPSPTVFRIRPKNHVFNCSFCTPFSICFRFLAQLTIIYYFICPGGRHCSEQRATVTSWLYQHHVQLLFIALLQHNYFCSSLLVSIKFCLVSFY